MFEQFDDLVLLSFLFSFCVVFPHRIPDPPLDHPQINKSSRSGNLPSNPTKSSAMHTNLPLAWFWTQTTLRVLQHDAEDPWEMCEIEVVQWVARSVV